MGAIDETCIACHQCQPPLKVAHPVCADPRTDCDQTPTDDPCRGIALVDEGAARRALRRDPIVRLDHRPNTKGVVSAIGRRRVLLSDSSDEDCRRRRRNRCSFDARCAIAHRPPAHACSSMRPFHKWCLAVRPGSDTSGMAKNFIAVDREQGFLMPPDLREWLPEGHLAWCLLDAVAEMDLSAFYVWYREDGPVGRVGSVFVCEGAAALAPSAAVSTLTGVATAFRSGGRRR